jgi:hypothetical protein
LHQESGSLVAAQEVVNVDIHWACYRSRGGRRSQHLHQIGDIALRLPTPEDLIVLKAVAHRPKDLLDIAEILKSHSDLDCARIERWVREFAAALEMPELWEDITPLLKL